MALPEKEYHRIRHSGHTMGDYAPDGVYNYYKLGGCTIMATLNPDLLTSDFIPMLKEFYSEYGDKKYSLQYDAVLQELDKLDTISFGICEKLGYEKVEAFYPVFINDADTKPFLMYEDGVEADCTGIILCAIPPETATFSMLYTLEQEIQNKLVNHKLAKALKVCMMSPAEY
ncbi:MAG: hypothetical protein ACI3ZP_08195 [Candidatus Cryptobacteroides sp.]